MVKFTAPADRIVPGPESNVNDRVTDEVTDAEKRILN